jgi:hypothetical protein
MERDAANSTRKFDGDGDEQSREAVRILPDDTLKSEPPGRAGYVPYEPQPPAPASNAGPVPRQGDAGTQPRRSPTACSIVVVTFGVLALSCILLTFATIQGGLGGIDRLTGILPSLGLPLRTPTVTIDTSRPSVVERVRVLSKLETVHYQMEKVISGKSTGPLPDFFTSDRILLVAHGEVVGGIDFAGLSSADVEVADGRVMITIPDPEILYSKLDNDRTYVYDRQTGLFNKPDPNLESQLRSVAEQQIRQAAIEDGILLKARENAEETLRTLVEGLGYEEVEFREGP